MWMKRPKKCCKVRAQLSIGTTGMWCVLASDTFYVQLWLCDWFSPALVLSLAGCELHPAGQVGGGQADANEASCSTSRSKEHVQADGQAAQQDAILQCMKFSIFVCQLYIQIKYLVFRNNRGVTFKNTVFVKFCTIFKIRNCSMANFSSINSQFWDLIIPWLSCSLVAHRRWQSFMWSGACGMRKQITACRITPFPATNTWNSSAKSVMFFPPSGCFCAF